MGRGRPLGQAGEGAAVSPHRRGGRYLLEHKGGAASPRVCPSGDVPVLRAAGCAGGWRWVSGDIKGSCGPSPSSGRAARAERPQGHSGSRWGEVRRRAGGGRESGPAVSPPPVATKRSPPGSERAFYFGRTFQGLESVPVQMKLLLGFLLGCS